MVRPPVSGYTFITMQSGRTTFGILIDWPDQGSGYQANIINGIRSYASEHDINLITLATGRLDSPYDWERPRELLFDFMRNDGVFSGFILLSSSLSSISGTDRLLEKIRGLTRQPIVSLAVDLEGYTSVTVDNAHGFRELIGHLAEYHGYRDIAHISGPLLNQEGRQRWEILKETCAAKGISIPPSHFYEGDFSMNAGSAAVSAFLDERRIRPEAIVCANDNMAIGAWEELRRRGIRVPSDMALTGFDDLRISDYFDLPFTTVRQPLARQGAEAARALHALSRGEKTERLIELPTEAVYRFSCGCLTGGSGKATPPPEGDERFVAESLDRFGEAARREFLGINGDPIARAWNKTLLVAIERGKRESTLFYVLERIRSEYGSDRYGESERVAVLSRIDEMKHMTNEFYVQSDLLMRMSRQSEERQIVNRIGNIGANGGDELTLTERLAGIRGLIGISGAKNGFVSLFRDYKYDPEGLSRLAFAFIDGKEADIGEEREAFPTASLLHPGFVPEGRYELQIELLFGTEREFGLVGLDMGSKGLDIFELARMQLSSAIGTYLARHEMVELNRKLQSEVAMRQETQQRLQRALDALESLSLTDELTGLHNRRGFMTLGGQQLKYCQREREPYIVFFIDLDGLKAINDRFGHDEGDCAIRLAAKALARSFRETDIVARLGGDEFTVFAGNAGGDIAATLKARIQANLDAANAEAGKGYAVEMSLGAYISGSAAPAGENDLSGMLREADRELYEIKRIKKLKAKGIESAP